MKQLFIKEDKFMVSWEWLVVTFMIGGWFGFLAAALCNAAKDDKKED